MKWIIREHNWAEGELIVECERGDILISFSHAGGDSCVRVQRGKELSLLVKALQQAGELDERV